MNKIILLQTIQQNQRFTEQNKKITLLDLSQRQLPLDDLDFQARSAAKVDYKSHILGRLEEDHEMPGTR